MKKTLKKIHIFSFILIGALLNSCAVDDDPAIRPSGTIVTASLDKTGEIFVFPSPPENEATVNVVLSSPVETTSQFIYTLNGVEKSVVLNSGDTVAPITIPNVVGNVSNITLTKAVSLYNTSLVLGAQTSVKLVSVPAASANAINIVLSLDSPTDVFFSFAAFNSDGGWEADLYGGLSTSFSIPINANIQNSIDISPDFYYAIDIYSAPLTDPGYTIYVVKPDTSIEIFSGSNLDLNGSTDQDVILVDVSDDPDVPGNKLFNFTQNLNYEN
ncbi:hypothetical protein C7447_101148 [Tenacibaculum adriaticum]|uniref:DUF1735 domain-containing protein n=1 Tax=Tenacibaculum adriaticum TaxID=413713 RepID=A0A5S5DW96_9FLAO|nr:hypothetical protein [Tenacibaculum adriaticum]TYP99548.1 hypothetical protein C7447_101148 [Tenacibaculum adriaticum]